MSQLQVQCPLCNETVSAGQYCDRCGASLVRTCPSCAGANRPGARFCTHCGTSLSTGPPATARVAAEQKHVTILFADICGSTGMIESLDAEDASLALDAVLQVMGAAVRRMGGVVNQRLGDGVMALFGAPAATEDHAARACFAALAILADVAAMGALALPVRVGLCSGPVILRRTGQDDEDYEVAGVAAHIAARLEQRADPGTILLAPQTLQLVAGIARTEPLGPAALKGLAQPLELHRLLGAHDQPSWALRSGRRSLSSFVGRAGELAKLAAVARRTRAGHQAVILVGDAGMGKSRLVHEFLQTVPPGAWHVIRVETTAQSAAVPYVLLTAILRQIAGCTPDDALPDVAARLRAAIAALDLQTGYDPAPLLLHLDPDAATAAFTAAAHRNDLVRSLAPVLQRHAEQRPVILVVEDYHWLDASSAGLLDALRPELERARLLLLLTTRPERRPGWGQGGAGVAEIELEPLSDAQADAMLGRLIGEGAELAPLRALVVARAGGTPFFLEEFAQSLREQGALAGGAPSLSGIVVPASAQGILAARIDRLPPLHRRVLQVAAVVGRDVPGALLETVADLPPATVAQAVDMLQAARFLVEAPGSGGAMHSFSHALTQAVAYETLLRSDRRALHGRVLRALEAPGAARDSVDQLAHHAMGAEAWPEAARYAMEAGERASRRSAPTEARAYLQSAITALERQPPTAEIISQGVNARLSLRGVFASLTDTDGQQQMLQATLAEADRLAELGGDRLALARAYVSRSAMLSHWGDLPGAIGLSRTALAIMQAEDDGPGVVGAVFALAQALWYAGDLAEAREVLTAHVGLARSEKGQQRSSATFVFPAVGFLSYLARVQAEGGEHSESLATIDEARRLATRSGGVFDQTLVNLNEGAAWLAAGEVAQAVEVLERTLALVRSQGIEWHLPSIACLLGAGWVEQNRHAEARQLLDQAIAFADRNRHLARRWLCAPPLVRALAGPPHNDIGAARALAARTVRDAEPRGYRRIVRQTEAALARAEASWAGPG